MTMWKPGMPCVCVDDSDCKPPIGSNWNPKSTLDGLSKGSVYRVARVYRHWFDNEICLQLQEIVRNVPMGEEGFSSRRFRPLSETRLDQFRQHLAPKPKVEERV